MAVPRWRSSAPRSPRETVTATPRSCGSTCGAARPRWRPSSGVKGRLAQVPVVMLGSRRDSLVDGVLLDDVGVEQLAAKVGQQPDGTEGLLHPAPAARRAVQ